MNQITLTRPDGSAVWIPQTVPEILARASRDYPDAVAIEAEGCSLTYAQYARAVAQTACWIAQTGEPGDTVVIILPNMAATAIAIFASQSAGRAAATLNPQYTPAELAPMIEDARASVAIVSSDVAERVRHLFHPETRLMLVDSDEAILTEPDPEIERMPQTPALPAPSPEDLAVLQFTGGSTGRPKGVELTHRAVATNIAQREAVLPTHYGEERILCFMPMFHSFAAAMCINLAAYSAGTLVILPRYRPDWVVEAIARHRITRLPAGPTVFNSLVQYEGLNREATKSLRCAYSGSAPLGIETLARWERLTGVPVFEGYGQSEAGPILTYFGPGHEVKPGCVGPPVPLTDLRIVDPADPDRLLPPGAVGEVVARGPQVMRGYRGLDEETRTALRDGWLHTGDLGRIDEDGHLTIADRKKDMILISGYNVFPREVDEALLAHDDVAGAACVGAPDAYRGERLIAFIVARAGSAPGPDALGAWLKERLVAYKHPAEYRFLDHLPLTAAGKVDKQALKALAAESKGTARVA